MAGYTVEMWPAGLLLGLTLVVPVLAQSPPPPEPVTFPTEDGGLIQGDLYGKGRRGVILVHGGRFNKESWPEQARALEAAGFRVLAIDLRGYGQSKGPGSADIYTAPLHLDVLAAVTYLRTAGTPTIYGLGGSLGGGALASASAAAPGQIERLILLGSEAGGDAPKLTGRKLFLLCRNDLGPRDIPRLPRIRADFEKTPEPKEMIVLECSEHAQFMFTSSQGERTMKEILRFLTAP